MVRGGRRLLDGVDVGIPRGRTTALVGPSGAGKSTLLRCLNRLEEPAAGRVLFEGRDIRDLDPRQLRRRVGMVFQTPVLFAGDVRANLAYGLAAVDDATLATALERVQLAADHLHRDAATLSVGEAQRVTIARALVHEPDVLLLDEPTSALDPDAVEGIEGLLQALVAARRLSAVIVTHDLDQAARLADRAVLVRAGRVAAVGTVAEVRARWRSERR